MGTKVSDDLVSTVRSVVGSDYSDMDIIRALHMANRDPTAAINIIFDTPNFSKPDVATPSPSGSNGRKRLEKGIKGCRFGDEEIVGADHRLEENESVNGGEDSVSGNDEWWLVGCSELAGLSTCKGRKLKSGDELVFTFPVSKKSNTETTTGKRFGRVKPALRATSDIVRFSTKDSGEIGRIPNEWARCLLPLVRDKKIKIEGSCKSAPDVLGIMDTILLSVRYASRNNLHQLTMPG